MKEITRIHLAKIPYEIEVSAKKQLEKYLKDLKIYSSDKDIFEDVEIRITEILAELGVKEGGIITEKEISKIEAQIGSPEVFQDTDFTENNEGKSSAKISKRLYRDEKNGMIAGVASGLAQYLNIDAVWVRLVLIVMFFMTFGGIVPIYILSILVIPAAKNANDILRLRGENITANSIREVNEEYNFEKIHLRNLKIAKAFGIIFGIFAVLAFLGGVTAIILGNLALSEIYSAAAFANAKDAGIGVIVSANILGFAYLLLTGFVAKMLFKLKITKIDIFVSIISVVIAFVGLMGFITSASLLRDKVNNRVSQSLISERVKIDSAKMKNIKKLEVDSSVAVFYHIADEPKIEFTHFNFEKDNLETNFDGETLKLNLNKVSNNARYFYGGNQEEIHIYGPELSEINLKSSSQVKYFAKNAEKIKVDISKNGSVNFENSAKIDNLEVYAGEFSNFYANGIDTKNLSVNSNGGNLELNKVENADVKTNKCNSVVSKNTRLKMRAEKVKVNGYDFNENTKGQCLYLENPDEDQF